MAQTVTPGAHNPRGEQPDAETLAKQSDKVCIWCKPMHIMSGPHFGADVPENLVRVTREGHTMRAAPHEYQGTPCTSGMCPAGEKRARQLMYAPEPE